MMLRVIWSHHGSLCSVPVPPLISGSGPSGRHSGVFTQTNRNGHKIWASFLIVMFASCCDIVPTSDSSQRSPSVSLPTGVTGPERGNLGARGSGSGSVASPVMVITIDGFRMGRGEGGEAVWWVVGVNIMSHSDQIKDVCNLLPDSRSWLW